MRKKNNDSSATPPDDNQPSGTDLTPPKGEQPSTPDTTPSLNTLSVDIENDTASKPAGMPRRQFLRGLATGGATIVAGSLLAGVSTPASASGANPRPGSPNAWEASRSIYGGNVNLATGNVNLTIPITSWSGTGGGLNFALVFNSQS